MLQTLACALDAPLREPKQCQPRLGVVAKFVGLLERFLGRLQVADPQPEFADLVKRGRGVAQIEGWKLGTCLPSL